jgi:hypothetical protein
MLLSTTTCNASRGGGRVGTELYSQKMGAITSVNAVYMSTLAYLVVTY